MRPKFGFHLVLTSFNLEFSSFWISRLFDLGDLSVLENGSLKYFENCLKSMQTFQRLMGGMNRWGRLHLNQIRSAVRSEWQQKFHSLSEAFRDTVYMSMVVIFSKAWVVTDFACTYVPTEYSFIFVATWASNNYHTQTVTCLVYYHPITYTDKQICRQFLLVSNTFQNFPLWENRIAYFK